MSRRFIIIALLVPILAFSANAQLNPAMDSLGISPGVQELIDAKDPSQYVLEYSFFFNEVKNFPSAGYDTLVSVLSRLENNGFRARFDYRSIFTLLKKAKEDHDYSFDQLDNLVRVVGELGTNYSRAEFNRYINQLELLIAGVISDDRSSSIWLKNADFEIKFNKPAAASEVQVFNYSSSSGNAQEAPKAYDPLTEPMLAMFDELGIVLHLKKGDMYFANYLDTFKLKGTEGYYRITEGTFKGQDGRLTWENRGYAEDERFARVKQYEFSKTARKFGFENVLFMDNKMLNEPANGDLSFELSLSRLSLSENPQFLSYGANNQVKGLGNDNLTFTGGLYLKGNEVLTNTKYSQSSVLEGSRNGQRKFKAMSGSFVFDEEKGIVTADNASIILYHDKDSIVNSVVSLFYDYNNELLRTDATAEGFQNSPFRSSFFDVDIVGDRLSWDLSTDSMDISIVAAKREIPLIVESKEFFSLGRYRGLSQIYGFHPLTIVIETASKAGDQVYVSQLAAKYNLNEKLVANTMNFLKSNGFVEYEESFGQVTVLEKGVHYYNSYLTQFNPSGYDYDDLLISSIIGSQPNATISFSDSAMTVRGIENFVISDSLDVLITPDKGEIKILKNRDIKFNGALNAGNFRFNGSDFKFEYDSFLVRLVQIDSIELAVELAEGQKESLTNQLINTDGILLINEPNNKSALASNPNFPIFISGRNASVDFSNEEVLNGAYDSTVYFDVPPFELDSVADADPTKYSFQGTLYSNGILPEFNEDLKVMPDNSFGFIHDVPDSGYNLYQTDAKVFGQLQLDNQGITTPGIIEYLTGSFEVEKATLFLDSLVAENGLRAQLRGEDYDTVPFPDMNVEEYSMNWLARSDSMILENLNKEKPFNLFENQADLNGQLVLQTTGLLGLGEMNLGASSLISDSISFMTQSFNSRHSTFTLTAENSIKPILSSEDVVVNYDLSAQLADIAPEVAGNAALEFPFAQFKTSIPTAQWDIDKNVIRMSKPEEIPLEESFFYTTNEALDSLVFNATAAEYDIETSKLTVQGIPYIAVADARITPQGDSLTILENSKIDRLTNATIILDTINGYHRMFDANIDILSRGAFRGNATYELVNVLQDTFAIKFNEFVAVPANDEVPAHTKASGYVDGSEGVKVSSGFIFEGDITMYAYKKALELNGAVKLDLAGLSERNIWIEYNSNDDIAEVVVPFDEALTRQGQPLNAGVHFDARGDIYMSFITEKKDYMDFDLFVPKGGNLYFDPFDSAFKIDNPLKLEDPNVNFAGSMFSYAEANQEVTFEGKLNFLGGPRGENIRAAGKGRGNLDSATFEISTMFTLAFGLSPEGLGAMAADLKKIGDEAGAPRTLDDRSELIYRVAEFIGDEATRKWDNSFRAVPIPLYSASQGLELQKDIVISNADLKWSKQNRAFYSEGKIGLSNVSNVNLDQEIDGFIEIRKTTEGDIFTLLLELTDGTWYYFNYDGYTMATFSSNEAYNALVQSFNTGKYRVGSFNTLLITQSEVIQWVTDFRKLYYGLDEPYRLLMAGDSPQRLKKKGTVEGDGF